MEKSKKRSKNRIFEFFYPDYGFSFSREYFQSITTGISIISWKTKNLERFFVKNERFGLKLGVFVKKSKNRSKNRVFDFFGLKIGFFSKKPVFTSYAFYKKLISQKIKKLGRFPKKNSPPPRSISHARGGGTEFWKSA